MDNYTKAEITKPSGKYPKGEMKGRRKVIVDRFTLVDTAGTAGLNVNDQIFGMKVPTDSLILNVKAHINKSLGATGIFEIGKSSNADAYIGSIDGGGQAAFTEMNDVATEPGIYERITDETQIIVNCTEVMDDSVLDAVLTIEVEYVND